MHVTNNDDYDDDTQERIAPEGSCTLSKHVDSIASDEHAKRRVADEMHNARIESERRRYVEHWANRVRYGKR